MAPCVSMCEMMSAIPPAIQKDWMDNATCPSSRSIQRSCFRLDKRAQIDVVVIFVIGRRII